MYVQSCEDFLKLCLAHNHTAEFQDCRSNPRAQRVTVNLNAPISLKLLPHMTQIATLSRVCKVWTSALESRFALCGSFIGRQPLGLQRHVGAMSSEQQNRTASPFPSHGEFCNFLLRAARAGVFQAHYIFLRKAHLRPFAKEPDGVCSLVA